MLKIFFKDYGSIYLIIACTIISYVVLLLFIRISGKRTLSNMNPFDFVVTVALGSTLSAMIVNMVPILNGSMALAVLIGIQYLFAFMVKHFKFMKRLINATPTILMLDGNFIAGGLKREQITRDEIFAEIRKQGLESIDDVKAIVMELNGEISVVRKSAGKFRSSLEGLKTED